MGRRQTDPGRRYRLRLTDEAKATLRGVRSENRSAFQAVDRFIGDLRRDPMQGYPLKGEWEGCRAAHVYNDRYRVIWEPHSPDEGSFTVHRAGRRHDPAGASIYDMPRAQDDRDDEE